MARVLHRIGPCADQNPWRFVIAWMLVGAAVAAAGIRWGAGTTPDFTIPGAESQQAVALLEERFPGEAGDPVRVVFAAEEGSVTVLASMIGIAVGIDYALFVVTRHREHLAQNLPLAEAAAGAAGGRARPR